MIKKIAAPLLLMIIFLSACLKDPDPQPETIDTYQYYYNYLLEPYDIQWEIDDQIIDFRHSYGVPAGAIIQLDQSEQEVLFQTREPDAGHMIDSLSYLLFENGSYMLAQMGSEEEPHLLCEPMDTRSPSVGMTKVLFLHAAPTMNPVDIYIGGDLPEDKVLPEVSYTTITEYLEITDEKLRTAIVITPASTLPADSIILSYTVNTIFQTGRVYLCVIGHSENSIETSYQMQVIEQPVY